MFDEKWDYFMLHVCCELSRLLYLACHVYLFKTEIIFVRIEMFVFIFAKLLAVFLVFKFDGDPRPDGYKYVYEFLVVCTDICMNFYNNLFINR
jgi:hypothetical protein